MITAAISCISCLEQRVWIDLKKVSVGTSGGRCHFHCVRPGKNASHVVVVVFGHMTCEVIAFKTLFDGLKHNEIITLIFPSVASCHLTSCRYL